ncbi:MAG: SGNH/GDSL hydrolase family protein [Xanthomonadales bacterium]|nr:SGNH/GDSL hydrolase family protein [Xanthomonadales bacterium]
MRWLLLLLIGLSSPLAVAAAPLKILFVGNSLLYYNDVPRAVAALLEAEGTHPDVEVEMLAEGGATLAEHLGRDALDRALAQFGPDLVVLQDRGPYPLCAAADADCARSPAAFADAIAKVRAAGARPLLFATWLGFAQGQAELSRRFAALAQEHDVPVADVGRARQLAQELPLHSYLDATTLSTAPWWQAPLLPAMDLPPPDGHPDEAGGWVIAAALSRSVLGHALPADLRIGAFCRSLWAGARLSATRPAYRQMPKATQCRAPQPQVVSIAVLLANQAAQQSD